MLKHFKRKAIEENITGTKEQILLKQIKEIYKDVKLLKVLAVNIVTKKI